MRLFLVFLSCSFLFSCAGHSSGLKVDLTKLRLWVQDSEDAQPLPSPYVVDFESGSRTLTLVAVDHSYDGKSPDARLLQEAMAKRRFSVLVAEGFPRSRGLSPNDELREAAKDGSDGFFRNGETSIPVSQAAAKRIPFVGAEPEEGTVLAAAHEAGFDSEDLFGFYMVRQVAPWRRDGTLSRETFAEAFAGVRPRIGKQCGFVPGKEPSLETFLRWYKSKIGRPFEAKEIQSATTAPLPTGALVTQKISAITHRVRNEHIARVIEEMLNRYGRIFVVLNSALFPVQQPALESLLGKPTRISDQP